MDTRKDVDDSEILEQIRYTSLHNIVENDAVFRIPSFQRFFVWDEDNVERFFRDLIDSAPDDEVFLGDVLLKNGDEGDIVKVIDGQQRIAIMLILMRVMVGKEDLDQDKREALQELLDGTNYDYSQLNLQQEDMRDYFEERILKGKTRSDANYESVEHFDPVEKIESARKWLDENISNEIDNSDLGSLDDFVDFLEEKVGALVVKIERNEYEIFDSINSKGRPLEPADKIKTFYLKRSTEQEREEVEESWNRIYEIFDFDSEEVTRFLRTYYESREGQKKGLYKRFRELLDEESENPEDSSQEIKEYAKIYQKVVNPGDENWSSLEKRFLINLDFMGFKTPYRLIIQVAKTYDENDKAYNNQRLFRDLLRNLDKFFFLKRIIGGKHPQTLKDRMTEWSTTIYGIEDLGVMKNKLRDYNQELENEIKSDLESDFEYTLKDRSEERSDLTDGSTDYGGFKKKTIFYILFRVYTNRADTGTIRRQNIEKWKEDEVEDQTIEHIMPVDLGEDWEEEIEEKFLDNWLSEQENITVEGDKEKIKRYREVLTDSLGNHTALLRIQNSKVGNRVFQDKKPIYEGKWDEVDVEPTEEEYGGESDNPLFEDILNREEWGPRQIQNRREELIEDLKDSLRPE